MGGEDSKVWLAPLLLKVESIRISRNAEQNHQDFDFDRKHPVFESRIRPYRDARPPISRHDDLISFHLGGFQGIFKQSDHRHGSYATRNRRDPGGAFPRLPEHHIADNPTIR